MLLRTLQNVEIAGNSCFMRRDAFEAVHQLGQAHLRRIVDQQVYVVGFAVEFLQHRFEVGADRSEYFLQARAASNTFPRRLVTNTKCA